MYEKMCLWNRNTPGGNKVQIGYFQYEGHSQGYSVYQLFLWHIGHFQ